MQCLRERESQKSPKLDDRLEKAGGCSSVQVPVTVADNKKPNMLQSCNSLELVWALLMDWLY